MTYEPPPVWFILGIVTNLVVLLPLVLWIIFSCLRRSGAVKAAVALVESNPEAMMFLGSPLTVGRFVYGRINVSPIAFFAGLFRLQAGSGYASLSIPLQGPRGKFRLRVKLEKINGVWRPFSGRIWTERKEIVLIAEPPRLGQFKRLLYGDFGWR